MTGDQDPKQSSAKQGSLRLSDLRLKSDLGSEPALVRAAAALTKYNRATELALGLGFSDIQAKAERYRALLEPSPAVKAALKAFSTYSDPMERARRAVGSDFTGMVKLTPEIQRYVEDQHKLSTTVHASSAGLKYVEEQLKAPSLAQLGVSGAQFAAIRAAGLDRFEIPQMNVLAAQFKALDDNRLYATHKLLGTDYNRLVRAASAMQTPWFEAANSAASVARFAGLYSLGTAVRQETTFSDEVAGAIRASLGDWRDRVTRGIETLDDVAVRTDFYVEHGLDRTLTDWPDEAFEEGLDVTEIRGERPSLADLYGSPVVGEADPENEAGFARNIMAYDWLLRFETQIRRFIDQHMIKVYGDNWPEQQLPKGMFDSWRDKQKKDPHSARHSRLIVYADFTEYELIICKRDNFTNVFAPFFKRAEHIRECMQRLAFPRIQVMHSRLLTQDDELLLFAELRRLTSQFARLH